MNRTADPTESAAVSAPLSLASAAAGTVRWLLNGRDALAFAVEDGLIRREALQLVLAGARPLAEDLYVLDAAAVGRYLGQRVDSDTNVLFVLTDRRSRPVAVLLVTAAVLPDDERLKVACAVAAQAAFGLECVGIAEHSARLLAKEHLLAEVGREVSAMFALEQMLPAIAARLELLYGGGLLLPADAAVCRTVGAGVTRLPDGLEALLQAADRAAGPLRGVVLPPAAAELTAGRPVALAALRSGGRLYGALAVPDTADLPIDDDDVDLLEALAAQVAGPIAGAVHYAETERLAAQLRRQAERLAVLNQVAGLVTSTQPRTTIWAAVVEVVQRGFGYPQVDLLMADELENELILVASAGAYVAAPLGSRQHMNLGLLGRAARTGEVLNVADVRSAPDYLEVLERAAIRSELVVPISGANRIYGMLNVESPAIAAFQPDDETLLRTAADMLAGLMANMQLSDRAQAAAVLEERQRLARELHDSVSQQLFSMTLTAQAARAHLDRSPERLPALLERLQETAAAALAEMRALIHQLRPPALSDQGLVVALQQYAQTLAGREQLHIALQVVGDDRAARGLELPVFRIVQEALNNIVKHAAARSVQISLEFLPERLLIRVVDDGRGFDPSVTPSGTSRQFGLLTMRERAAEAGGTCTVASQPGRGTAVTVVIPRPTLRPL
jgi:signal transduction histidine kinase